MLCFLFFALGTGSVALREHAKRDCSYALPSAIAYPHMDHLAPQGLLVAACLIGCTVFAVILCLKVLPDPADALTTSEAFESRTRNRLVLGWVVLACASLIAGHLIAYCMLGNRPAC